MWWSSLLPSLMKFKEVLLVLFSVTCFTLGGGYIFTKATDNFTSALDKKTEEITSLKLKNVVLQSSLDDCKKAVNDQNTKIKELEVTQPDFEKIKAELEKKYKKRNIPTKDANCEQKVKYYEERAYESSKN